MSAGGAPSRQRDLAIDNTDPSLVVDPGKRQPQLSVGVDKQRPPRQGLDIFGKPIIVQHVPFRLDVLVGDHLIIERHNGDRARAVAAKLVEQCVIVGGVDLQIAR